MDRLLFVKPLSRLTPFRPSWSVGAFFVFLFILLLPALCAQGQASNYFSLAVSPSALTVSQGAGGTDSLTITPNNGFIGTVYISVSGLPSGVTASFNPQYTRSVYLGDGYVTGGGGTVALTLNAVSGTLPGSYPLTLKAQIASSNSTRPGPSLTMPLTLTVTAGPPPGLTATATDAYISLSWQPVAGALSYDLYSTSSLQTPPTVIQSVLGTSTLDSTITLGQTYYYQVSTLTAAGESALSAPVTVTPLGNLSPVVKMTAPFDGSAVTAGTSLLLSASAMPRSGSLSKIDFYNAGTLIGTTTASPYNFIWNNIPSGRFFLTAVATDSGGHTATSQPITLTVLAAPSGAAITSAQAIQAAQTFCQAVGAPIPAATPTSAQTTTTSPTYPGTVWQIGFSGAATVEIADATSIVVSYFNETLAAQLDANSLPPGTPITQDASSNDCRVRPASRLGTPCRPCQSDVHPVELDLPSHLRRRPLDGALEPGFRDCRLPHRSGHPAAPSGDRRGGSLETGLSHAPACPGGCDGQPKPGAGDRPSRHDRAGQIAGPFQSNLPSVAASRGSARHTLAAARFDHARHDDPDPQQRFPHGLGLLLHGFGGRRDLAERQHDGGNLGRCRHRPSHRRLSRTGERPSYCPP